MKNKALKWLLYALVAALLTAGWGLALAEEEEEDILSESAEHAVGEYSLELHDLDDEDMWEDDDDIIAMPHANAAVEAAEKPKAGFSQGYVDVAEGEVLYADAALTQPMGSFALKGQAYAVSEGAKVGGKTVLSVAFDARKADAGIVQGYMAESRVKPLAEDAQHKLYASLARDAAACTWKGVPLPVASFTPVEDALEEGQPEEGEPEEGEPEEGQSEEGEPEEGQSEEGEPEEGESEEGQPEEGESEEGQPEEGQSEEGESEEGESEEGQPEEGQSEEGESEEGESEEGESGEAEVEAPVGRTTADTAIYSLPDASADILAELPEGAEVRVLFTLRSADELWYEVEYEGSLGYIPGDALELVEPEAIEAPAAEDAPQAESLPASFTARVAGMALRVTLEDPSALPAGAAMRVETLAEEQALADAEEGLERMGDDRSVKDVTGLRILFEDAEGNPLTPRTRMRVDFYPDGQLPEEAPAEAAPEAEPVEEPDLEEGAVEPVPRVITDLEL